MFVSSRKTNNAIVKINTLFNINSISLNYELIIVLNQIDLQESTNSPVVNSIHLHVQLF